MTSLFGTVLRLKMNNKIIPVGLIVATDTSAMMFSSVSAAEGYLEGIDVKNGEYPKGYGPDGQPYDLLADGNEVIIVRSKAEPDIDVVKKLVEKFLIARGIEFSSDTNFNDMLQLVEPFVNDGFRHLPYPD